MIATRATAYSETNFFKKVVSDHNRHSYFVVVNVCSPTYNGKIAVENSDLYSFFHAQNKITETSYEKIIIDKLSKNECLKIKTSKLENNFTKVRNIAAVNKTAQKGMKVFVETYFNNNVLKSEINGEYRAAIICKLFEWKIACKTDDESGYLIIVQ